MLVTHYFEQLLPPELPEWYPVNKVSDIGPFLASNVLRLRSERPEMFKHKRVEKSTREMTIHINVPAFLEYRRSKGLKWR